MGDLGQSFYSDEENERIWCLDPIDGTKGFLRGVDNGQYCVALCLLVNGTPEIGILGCPNLNIDCSKEKTASKNNGKGCMFVAKRNNGCYQIPLCLYENNTDDDDEQNNNEIHNENWIKDIIPSTIKRISSSSSSLTTNKSEEKTKITQDSIFCTIGVEKYGDPLGQCDAIMAELLHNSNNGAFHNEGDDDDGSTIIKNAIRMDSQAKYGVVARGEAQVYLRLPESSYVEWIWDHAAGSIIVQEAGGVVTDVDGNALDFSIGGPKLSSNVNGIIGTNINGSDSAIFHDIVLNAYRTQRKNRNL